MLATNAMLQAAFTAPERAMLPLLAVDLDEVLCETTPALIRFHNDLYKTNLHLSDFTSYEYEKVWGGTPQEAVEKVRNFYASDVAHNLVSIKGSVEAIKQLYPRFRIAVVTARQDSLRADTSAFLERHFAGLIDALFMCNHYLTPEEASSGDLKARRKSEVCHELGAVALVDDSLSTARDCAARGVRVFLFDLDGTYPWNQCAANDSVFASGGVRRVSGWQEIVDVSDDLERLWPLDLIAAAWSDPDEAVQRARRIVSAVRETVQLTSTASVLDMSSCERGLVALELAASGASSVKALAVSEVVLARLKERIQVHRGIGGVAHMHVLEQGVPEGDNYDLVVVAHAYAGGRSINELALMVRKGGVLLVVLAESETMDRSSTTVAGVLIKYVTV